MESFAGGNYIKSESLLVGMSAAGCGCILVGEGSAFASALGSPISPFRALRMLYPPGARPAAAFGSFRFLKTGVNEDGEVVLANACLGDVKSDKEVGPKDPCVSWKDVATRSRKGREACSCRAVREIGQERGANRRNG